MTVTDRLALAGISPSALELRLFGAPLTPLERQMLALGAPAAEAARAQVQASSWEEVIRYASADDPPETTSRLRPAPHRPHKKTAREVFG
jgi:hypothetical protein